MKHFLLHSILLGLLWGGLTISSTAQSSNINPACGAGTLDGPGNVFLTYGSAVNLKKAGVGAQYRSSLTIGQVVVSEAASNNFIGYYGYWGGLFVPPLGPEVFATQGDLLDRIQVSWNPNSLGSDASEGYKLYRDGVFMANFDSKTRNFNDFNVIAGKPYNYEVRGVNSYGEGSPGKALGFLVPNGVVTGWVQTVNGSPVPDALITLSPLQGFSARFGPMDGAFFPDTVNFMPTAGGEWTLTFWIKTSTADADAGLLSFEPFPLHIRPLPSIGGQEGISVAMSPTDPALLTGAFPDMTKNGWHHVALTADSDGLGRLYIDGVLVDLAALPPVPEAKTLNLGSRTGADGWDGRLDELRLYHRRLDEIDLSEVMIGTASSQTPDLHLYWKLDEEQGTKSFDIVQRAPLYFCGANFDADRPPVSTSSRTNADGYYRIEAVSYGLGTTFLAKPSKNFYMHRSLRFVRDDEDYATLPDFSVTPKATLELWVNSSGPDGEQCLLSKRWPGNDFRLLLSPNGTMNELEVYFNGQVHNFGDLGMGYQHLAFTINNLTGDVTAYKNGVSLGSHTFVGVTGDWSDPAEDWLVGARPSGGSRTDYYGGLIDEIALYDTTLSETSIQDHFQNARDMQENGLRVYFAFDEGSGTRLNHTGSALLPAGTNFGAGWASLAANQSTIPHVFSPVTRQVTLNPSVTSVDQVDFTDRSTIAVSGYVRYKDTDCFAPNVEILVNGASYSPKIFTDSTGKFLIDVDPGFTGTLSPKFEDHQFVPAFWDVFNVINPIAGILFNDITTRKITGQVAGGFCKKSIITAPPGMGMGTVCIVKIRTPDGCLERQITIDNQEGNFEFDNLPPVEGLTVAVIEHSNPAIKTAFEVQGGLTVDLSKQDTVVELLYFAPPELEIASGLTPVPGCVPEKFVLNQFDPVTVSLKMKEVYVATMSDDGICYLDTADFRIINEIADDGLDTAMSNGTLQYMFIVGTPNPSPPFLKTLQFLGTSLSGRTASLTIQAVVTGIRTKENTFTTLLPETPSLILRDPPGDGSTSYLEKNTKVCRTFLATIDYEVGGGGGLELHLGGNVNIIAGTPLVGIINNVGPIFDIGAEFQVTYQKISDSTFQTCTTINQKVTTNENDLIVGGSQGGDMYMGEAINIIFGFADKVTFDPMACSAAVATVLNVEPGDFSTTFIYSEYYIKKFLMRYLDELAADPGATPADVARYIESKNRWQAIIDRNTGLKEKAKFVRNISFDASTTYEYSETSDTSIVTSIEDLTKSEESLETHIGFEFNKFGFTGMLKFISATSDGEKNENGTEKGITTGYILKDNDPGDAYTIDVAMDSVYKTPVFRLKSGQTSCPWEDGTANREAPNLSLDAGSQFVANNVPANESAVFNLVLGNLSATNEDWTYGFTAIDAFNPHGAAIKLNGAVLDQNRKFIIPFGTSIPVTITVERGPVEYVYDSLQIALYSECEYAQDLALALPIAENQKFFSSLYLGVNFVRPCSEVDINVPEQNWVVFPDPLTVGPDDERRITVSGYNKNEPLFERIRVQYRRSDGDGAWINISPVSDVLKANLGDVFTQFVWETTGLADGPYEIRAVSICTGDAVDRPGFSQIIKGRIEREPPSLVGTPQPSDGVFHVGDEISFTFNKHVNCNKLIQADLLNPNNVGLYDAETGALIDADITCFENKIILDPNFQNEFFENRILRAELHDIEDLVGNKRPYQEWEFFVDRNELAWLTDSLGITKFENEPKTGIANIHNRGGYPVPFKILGAPDWAHISPNQGTLAANEIRPISFTLDSTLAFGRWSDSVILHTETGLNPFFMGGDEPLPLGVRVICRPPYGPANFSHFENAMGMVLKVNIEGAFSTDPEDIVAAFIDDELRGLANVQYFPQIGAYLAYLNVYGNPADMLKPLRLEVWDASECERYGSVVESFTFQPDNVIGILTNPQIIHTGGLLLREVPFGYGWNWLSFNLAFPDNSLDAALASLHHPENDLMKGQSAFSEYLGGWFGTLTNLNNTSMFIYRADVNDTLRMEGTPIDPLTTNIPLVAGWNWVGYVPNYALPINDALTSLPAQFGDIAKSQYAFAQYINPAFGWVGTLKYMSPPNGYQIKLAQAGTLTYPPPPSPFDGDAVQARGETEPVHAHWSVDPTRFEHTSTLIGMLRSDGANATTSDMELGAFTGGDVRGTTQAIYIEPLDAHLFFLTTYANVPGELLRFKLYNDADGSVRDLSETMYFAPNQHQGSIENPVPFEWVTTSAEEDFGTTVGFDVQPNPFATETTLRFNLPKAEEVTLTISDAQGREVVRRPLSAVAGPNVAIWNGRSDTGSWLSSGVYTVQLKTNAGSVVRKVVLQRLP